MLNGALFAAFSFINRGFSFILLLILANYIAPVEYGYLSLFTTVMTVIGYFIAFSTEGYFAIAYFNDGVEACKKVFSSVLLTSLLVLMLLLTILRCFDSSLAILLSLPSYCLYIALFTVFFNVYFHTFLEYFRVKENIYYYGLISCSNVLLNFTLSIILVKNCLMGWEGRVYAMFVVGALYGLISLCFFVKKSYLTRIDWLYWKTMLFWGIPLIPHLATAFIKQGCDRYIINYYHTTEDVGIFSFALTLTTIITMIGFGFNQSNGVDIFKICGDKAVDEIKKSEYLLKQRKRYLILYLMSAVFVVISCLVFIPLLLPKYIPSLKYLPILGVYGLLVCYYLIYTNYLFFYKKTKNLMYITFFSSLLHLTLSLLFTRFSLFYTCIIYCISQVIVVFLVRKIALRTLSVNLGTK